MTFHFKMNHLKICHTIKVMVNSLYQISQLYFIDISIWIPQMPLYADLIWDATSGAATNIFGFIDATLREHVVLLTIRVKRILVISGITV
jgi:hypothetical protein